MVVPRYSSASNSARPEDNSADPDNTRHVPVASPISSDNSTNPSPFTVLSQSLSPAIYTPLSLSVDDSHFFYDEQPPGDADPDANPPPDSQPSRRSRKESAPPNEKPEDDGLPMVAARETDSIGHEKLYVGGGAATLQLPAVAALSSTFGPASTSTTSTSSTTPASITPSPMVAATADRRAMEGTDENMEKGGKQHPEVEDDARTAPSADLAEENHPRNEEELIAPPKQDQVKHAVVGPESASEAAQRERQRQQQHNNNNPHNPNLPQNQQLQQQESREDEGAEITEFISRATGQPGSTPLPFLQLFSGRGRKSGDNTAAQPANPADNHTSSVSHAATRVADSAQNTDAISADRALTQPPSSPPTSLIEQLQESLQQSSALPSASANATTDTSSDLAHRPHRPQPIVRTTSDSAELTVCHPVPDLHTRSAAYVGNIAALEKTAERLSMTSSIEDAIRDLHCELKRSDSRRSSILAAAVNASANTKANAASATSDEPSSPANTSNPALVRHMSSASNIVEVNSAARHGGYSPAGYIMSPSHSLTSRLRSGSKNSTGRPDFDVENFMSRQGPGKSSTRSARSAKPSLAEIAESEPIALTQELMAEADRSSWHEEQQDGVNANATRREDSEHNEDTTRDNTRAQATDHVPTTDAFHNMLDEGSLHRPSEDLRRGPEHAEARGVSYADDSYRPPSRRSVATFDASNVFGDFDGVHCAPDLDMPGMTSMPEPAVPEPRASVFNPHNMSRPQSYYDEETGHHMLYYPARVPAMLNLPPKLSKKPKTTVRNARHSHAPQAMGYPGFNQPQYMPHDADATHARESVWLPDPVQSGEGFSSLFPSDQPEGQPSVTQMAPLDQTHEAQQEQHQQQAALSADGRHDPIPQSHEPSDHAPALIGEDNRRSRLLQNPPAAARASTFFDLPSASVDVGANDGSAMKVLDSILDASANAPVDAFVDHSFAGKLGKEVYGRERRAKIRKSAMPPVASSEQKENKPAATKKRMSLFPFGKSDPDGAHDRKDSGPDEQGGDNAERKSLSASVDGEPAGEKDQTEGQDDASSEEEEEEYQGPPTTLLAELQIRKQEQKMRTRNRQLAAAGGLQSTLLEMDAVAEAQRKNRKSRRVNLAWEDPVGHAEDAESEDEDVPLGILYAAKAAGNNDISAVVAELNRPIGLLERRELEENEPLSARRARLQGNEPMTLMNRRSMMTLNPGAAMSTHRLSRMPSPGLSPSRLDSAATGQPPQLEEPGQPVEPEVEGETLGERMRRLKEQDEAEQNGLPRARPVSSAFSAELLSQFGDLDDEGAAKAKTDKTAAPAKAGEEEEEETLGQRRKRLQAEREAREREISMNALTGNASQPSKRLSLANVLTAHPAHDTSHHREADRRRGPMPTTLAGQEAERRRAEEQNRLREQDVRLAALRSQMPQALHQPSTGTQAGGFRGGMYNDGSGGMVVGGVGAAGMDAGMGGYGANGFNASRLSLGPGYAVQAPQMSGYGGVNMNGMAQPMMHGGGVHRGYAGGNMGMGAMPQMGMGMMGMDMNASPNNGMRMMRPQGGMGGVPMNMGMNVPMHPMQMPMMPGQPGQVDSIERWRQSVMP
ncbi:hypothetical protein ACRALDRAFT_1065213 [Sodiomyces alcalophilus JCM 7366]|uniref:uncharacterized protein n=1 Tax=Sodiomyces alcalophilus JCM 7366 TaxID=591952 RepID=UPI0039B4C252